MVTLFRIWGCAWIVICMFAMGIFDFFLLSHRAPRVGDLPEGVVFMLGILALLASVLIARSRDRGDELQLQSIHRPRAGN